DSPRLQAEALTNLLPCPPLPEQEPLIERIYAIISEINNTGLQARLVFELGLHAPTALQAGLIDEAFKTASFLVPAERSPVLSGLITRLPSSHVALALDQVSYLDVDDSRQYHIDAELSLLRRWEEYRSAANLSAPELIGHILQEFSRSKRQYLLAILQNLAPILHRAAGESAVQQTAAAVLDTARWWP
ncbi:MAG: hypothetical protein IH586_09015, partial [Anaerolineaceae bacterium]|nr:hypothetical protein [Anaerolineaceae bacterium]